MAQKIIKVYDSIPEQWMQIELFHATAKLLPEFQKPTIVRYKGSDSAAGSVWISTLQHGNESTGLHVFLDLWKRLFKENVRLPHDVYFFVANGYAALNGNTQWGVRFAPSQVDNNRCWIRKSEQELADKFQIPTLQREQVKEVSDIIEQLNPRYLLDMHDTTGYNNALGFTLRDREDPERDKENRVLYALVDHVIYLQRLRGAFIDKFSENYIAFGVECGKTGTAAAFEQGKRMVWSFINLWENDQSGNAYKNLKRIVIKPEVKFDFVTLGELLTEEYDQRESKAIYLPGYSPYFLIRDDLEKMNQEDLLSFKDEVAVRTLHGLIGYYPGLAQMPFIVLDNGNDVTDKYFAHDGDYIVAKEHCWGQLFSTNKQNVRDSELGYVSENVNHERIKTDKKS